MKRQEKKALTVSCGSHSWAITTFEWALRRDLMRPDFQSQKTTLPSPSPLLIHFPSGENPTWQAYPATEWPEKRFLRFCRKLSVLYTRIWLSRDWAAKYLSIKGTLIVLTSEDFERLTRRVKCDSRHRVHMRLSNVFDHHWNVKVPCSDRLVVGRRDKSPVFVNKGDGIDRTKMLIVFLGNFA